MENLILLSGGLDSTLCLHKYGAKLAVGFDYDQPHAIELEYAAKIAGKYGVLFERIKVPTMPRVNDVVFAGRNAVFIAMGVAIAQARGLKNVIIGCNFSDHERFPDCRPPFIRQLSTAYQDAYGVSVHAPLLTSTKVMIADEAKKAGLPETWSCYNPLDVKIRPEGTQVIVEARRPCGTCAACNVRETAFGKRSAEDYAWTK